MKRSVVLIISILVGFPLVLAGILGLTYFFTGEGSVPAPDVVLHNEALLPTSYEWHSPLFAGMMYKQFDKESDDVTELGLLDGSRVELSVPDGYDYTVAIRSGDDVVFEGDALALSEFSFVNNGTYLVEIACTRDASAGSGYGTLGYRASFQIETDPRVESSEETVVQGDVLAVRVYNVTPEHTITANSLLSPVYFADSGKGYLTAYIPIDYSVEPLNYTVFVTVDDHTWRLPVQVIERSYSESVSETSYWSQGEAVTQNALNQKAVSFEPLFEQHDAECHWNGFFTAPVDGDITVDYGEHLIQGGTDSIRSGGVVIASTEGDDVVAPNGGRVVFAANLLNTGNTVVIEHGGGLKSYLYHLQSVDVKENDIVEKGAKIGTAGNTGATLSPGTLYEVRVAHRLIDPTLLLEESASLYYFERQRAA